MQVPSKRHTDRVQCYEPATMKYLGYFSELKLDEVGHVMSLLFMWQWIYEMVELGGNVVVIFENRAKSTCMFC